MKTLPIKGMVLGNRAFERLLGLEEIVMVETPRMGFVPLELLDSLLHSLPCEDTVRSKPTATEKRALTRT